MHNPLDLAPDISEGSLETTGGEPLAGSGFETEEPEPGFSIVDLVERE